MDRSLDLIVRLFCLGQLFTCLRPYLLVGLVKGVETGGLSQLFVGLSEAWPPARWLVYVPCLAILILGAKRPFVLALAIGHVIDVGASIWTNTLASGYSEKGLLVLVSVGLAGLLYVDRSDALTCEERGREEQGREGLVRQKPGREERLRGFLKGASAIGFAVIALNKMNVDFLDAVSSCSRDLNAELVRTIPFTRPLAAALSNHAWGALLMEALLLPLLLIVPRFGVLYAWGFFVSVAMVGPRATCFVFMALALVFVPVSDWQRLERSRRVLALGALASLLAGLLFWVVALGEARRFAPTQLLGRVSFMSIALFGIGLLGANLWLNRRALRIDKEPVGFIAPFRRGPRAAGVVAVGVLALLCLNELAPHLGLKSKYSLTMWSNLRSDQGRSNSYVFPAALRVSSRPERALLVVEDIRPVTPRAPSARDRRRSQGRVAPRRRNVPADFVAAHGTALAHLINIEAKRGPLRFNVTLDGQATAFEGAGPGSAFGKFIKETRPSVDWFEDAVMTLNRPQRCLGP